ncbi:hypothetical protein D3C74_408680 [compost metagenome]
MLLHIPSVDHIRPFSRFLCFIHRNIRILQQFLCINSILRILGDSDTCGNMYNTGIKLERLLKTMHQGIRVGSHFFKTPAVLEQNDEFITAKPEMPAAAI